MPFNIVKLQLLLRLTRSAPRASYHSHARQQSHNLHILLKIESPFQHGALHTVHVLRIGKDEWNGNGLCLKDLWKDKNITIKEVILLYVLDISIS